MDASTNDQSGHAPIYSKKRKTATRGKKKESKRPGGVSTLINLFEPRNDAPKKDDKSSTAVSSSYAFSCHGEQTDLGEGLALRPRVESSAMEITGNDESSSKGQGDKGGQDQSASEDDQGAASSDKRKSDKREAKESDGKEEQKPLREYSAEARTYHAYYDELQRAHIRGHYTWCRDHCLELLTEPRIPVWTRIQTLQLLSTMLQPAGAEQCLKEADQIIDILDPTHFQTQRLRTNNRKMKADREVWRMKKNLVGKDIEGVDEGADEGPSDEHFKLDRDLDAKLEQEVAEEMEPFRKPDVEMSDKDKAAGMPSPASSDT